VLKRSNEASSLAVSLPSVANLIKGRIDVVAANRVHWGARLALTAALSHFPELEPELELHVSRYNADLTEGRVDAFWTRMHQASESLSSRVLLPVTRSPPDGTEEE
jgi:hypothetical protein